MVELTATEDIFLPKLFTLRQIEVIKKILDNKVLTITDKAIYHHSIGKRLKGVIALDDLAKKIILK